MPTDRPVLLALGQLPDDWFPQLASIEDLVEIKRARTPEDAQPLIPEAEIIFAWEGSARWIRDGLARASKLRWIQNSSAGLERLLSSELIESSVIVTNGRGLYAPALAEFVMLSALYFSKDAPRLDAGRRKRRWDRFVCRDLAGQTMGIVGYGGTGRYTARLAKSFGMRVLAVKRNVTNVEGREWVDEMFPLDRWHELLASSDLVVNALPQTDDTRGMFGEPEFRAMKTTALYINVGRGATTRQDVLVRALKEQWIAGAGLDVYETEPLAADSGLWDLPNVLLSPHCTDMTPRYYRVSAQLLCDNVQRYIKGEPLANLVEDKQRGY